jgi:hypothetical protein
MVMAGQGLKPPIAGGDPAAAALRRAPLGPQDGSG